MPYPEASTSLFAIDIETFFDVDLPKCGSYAYSDSPRFEILLFAYAFDDEPTQVVDLALPLTLDGVGEVLNIKRKKLKEGVSLLRYFSMPRKPAKANGGRTRNRPEDALELWERFKAYCVQDVDAEREIRQKMHNYPIPENETELYRLDQEINDRGIMIDQRLAAQAVRCDMEFKARATAQAQQLTGLANPNSLAQVKGWLAERGIEVDSLDKKAIKGLRPQTSGEVREMLELRLLPGPLASRSGGRLRM